MKSPLPFTLEFERMCELSPDMLELLYKCLPFIEDAADDPCYKKGVVLSLEREIKALLNKIDEKPHDPCCPAIDGFGCYCDK